MWLCSNRTLPKKEKSHNLPTSDLVGWLVEVLNTKQKKQEVKRHPLSFQTTIRKTSTWVYHNIKSPGRENVYLHRLKVRVSTDYSIHFPNLHPLCSHWDCTLPVETNTIEIEYLFHLSLPTMGLMGYSYVYLEEGPKLKAVQRPLLMT